MTFQLGKGKSLTFFHSVPSHLASYKHTVQNIVYSILLCFHNFVMRHFSSLNNSFWCCLPDASHEGVICHLWGRGGGGGGSSK